MTHASQGNAVGSLQPNLPGALKAGMLSASSWQSRVFSLSELGRGPSALAAMGSLPQKLA